MKAILKEAAERVRNAIEGIRAVLESHGYAPGTRLYGRVPQFVLVRPVERPLGRKKYY